MFKSCLYRYALSHLAGLQLSDIFRIEYSTDYPIDYPFD